MLLKISPQQKTLGQFLFTGIQVDPAVFNMDGEFQIKSAIEKNGSRFSSEYRDNIFVDIISIIAKKMKMC